MKTKRIAMKLAVLSVLAGAALMSANATTINLYVDPNQPFVKPPGANYLNVLGAANPGAPASDADDVKYVNGILGLGLGGTGTVGADTIYRSYNNFGTLGAASAFAGSTGDNSGNHLTITLLAGCSYLCAKYDGPNGGTEVWYVGNLAAGTMLVLPANAFGSGDNQYGLSGTVQLIGTPSTQTVPDGASTMMLLGLAGLGTAAFVRRFKVQAQKA
jgi:MYXO-CTERM domain-containing protein